jgi:hypothetical protein
MKVRMRRNFSGTFGAQQLGANRWRLSQHGHGTLQLYLQGAESRAAVSLADPTLRDVGVEWRERSALLTFSTGRGGAERIGSVEAQSVLVHEALPHLYEALPLAQFDARARKFWRRVFWLVRIPGGRRLLKVLARRRPRAA